MKTDFDFPREDLIGPVVFRPDFNAHSEAVTVNQAWSLFFTGGQEDKIFGFNPELGRFFTNLVVAISVVGILSSFFLNNI